jgi:FkbM family methyltransferase
VILRYAYCKDALEGCGPTARDAVLAAARLATGDAPLALQEPSALPPPDGNTSWIVFGGAPTGRADVLGVTVGDEVRAPGMISAGDVAALERLVSASPDGGIGRLLRTFTQSVLEDGIRHRYGKEIGRLLAKKAAYVFGARRLGTVVGEGLQRTGRAVAGILDNNASLHGQPMFGGMVRGVGDDLDRTVPVIIGTTRFPYTLRNQLRAAGFDCVIPYPLMTLLDPTAFPPEIPYIGIHDDLVANRAAYVSEYLGYGDQRSRAVMDRVIAYRMTLDPDYLQGYFESEAEQYFDKDLIHFSDEEVFVDAGGFDGQTTLWFMERVGERYRRVYYFEPDGTLMTRSKARLAEKKDVVFCEAGAFDMNGVARFATTGTVNGAVSLDAGDVEIRVSRIDDVVAEPATFIKMDIEGAESQGLRGARDQIARHAPTLAIACYHRGEDLWRLGREIRDLNGRYRLYLRHYTEGGLETVLYALPLA